jgi:hypothetical protein
MARQCSTRLLSGAGERPFDDVVRLGAAALVLVVAMAVAGLPTGGKSSSWTALWSTVTASMQSRPADAVVGSGVLDQDQVTQANDDGYVEGLAKALNHDL